MIPSRADRRYAAYLFDLDGTLYVDEALTEGAAGTLAWIRSIGAPVAFLTNNPLQRGSAYAARLSRLGIPAAPDEVVTSLDALAWYVARHPPAGPALLLAEELVGDVLREAGVEVTTHPMDAALVVVSWDRGFDYAGLKAAFHAVRNGARIVATNPDPFCPTSDGGMPDCAAMLAALEACSGQRADAVVGKPSEHMAGAALARLGAAPADVLMVGDRLLTDVGLAHAAGLRSALVLTGATSAAEVEGSAIWPDLLLRSLADLIPVDEPPAAWHAAPEEIPA